MEQELRHRKSVRGDVDEIVDSKNGKVNTKGNLNEVFISILPREPWVLK